MSRRKSKKLMTLLAGAAFAAVAAAGVAQASTPPDRSARDGCRAPGTEAAGSAAAPSEPGPTFTYGYEQEIFSYNPNLSTTNASSNAVPLGPVLPDTFYFSSDGSLVMDENLLVSADVTSEDPQVVTYVINPDAVWSDGAPIDCSDFYLQWIASNGTLKRQNDDGSVATDPASGAELLLFDPAGTTGFEQIPSVDCSDDGKTVTTTYSSPFPDWKGLFTGLMPAHIVRGPVRCRRPAGGVRGRTTTPAWPPRPTSTPRPGRSTPAS